jgi:adenine-specific DNA-methyltransferase
MIETEKLDGASLDIAAEKRNELLRLFPEAAAEGGRVDIERLRLALGDSIEVGKERYGLNWPGKADCFKTIQSPSMATLLPDREKSVNFATTENLIIEGDNLEVLKLLQKSYLGKVKMIYIDPPYNTGNDFIYPDDYSESLQTYLQYTGQVDSEGRKFGTNSDTEGRFHSRWLNMMYPRIYLSRNLLRDDGVFFSSINDVELQNLLCLCNEIFGEDNHLGTFIWVNEGNIDNQSKIKTNHEYIVAYGRNAEAFVAPPVIDPSIARDSKLYRDYIENSVIKNGPANPVSAVLVPAGFPTDFDSGTIKPQKNFWPQLSNAVDVVDGRTVKAVEARSGWSSKDLLEQFIKGGCKPITDAKGQVTTFYMTRSGTIVYKKQRSENQSHVLTVLRGMGTVRAAATALAEDGITFSYPKPPSLIQYLVQVGSQPGDVVLDLFAGSGTTAESAVSQGRKFILVQLPESTAAEGPQTIADLCVERMRKAVERIAAEEARKLLGDAVARDLGFRVFKLAQSNVKEWDATIDHDVEALAAQLTLGVDHLRDNRTDMDIVYEVLLKSGYPLSAGLATEIIDDKPVYSIADGAFIICLERNLTLDLIRAIADKRPERVLFLDEGFAGNDQIKTNAVQMLKAREIVFRTL